MSTKSCTSFLRLAANSTNSCRAFKKGVARKRCGAGGDGDDDDGDDGDDDGDDGDDDGRNGPVN